MYKYGVGDLPYYSKKSFSHNEYDINTGIIGKKVYDFYISENKTIGDVLSGIEADGDVYFADKNGNEVNEMSVPVNGLYMAYTEKDTTPIYLKLITDNIVQYEYSGNGETDKNTLPDGLQTALGSFTDVIYPKGDAGRASDDNSVGVISENKGTDNNYSQYIQYTYKDILDKEMPIHTKMSLCLKEIPDGSDMDIHLIYTGNDGAAKWYRYARINSKGELLDTDGHIACVLEKNRWYNFDFVFYPNNMSADLKINGSYIITNMDFSCAVGFKFMQRLKINQTVPVSKKAEFIIDDIKVYLGAENKEADYLSAELELDYGNAMVDNDENIIYIDGTCDIMPQIKEGQNVRVYESDSLEKESNGIAKDGGVLVLQDKDVFKYYNIEAKNVEFYNVKEFTVKRSGSAVNVKYTIGCRKHNSPVSVILAKYNDDGSLKEIQMKDYKLYGTTMPSGNIQPEREFSKTVKFTSPSENGTYIRVYLFTDLNKLIPISKASNIIK